MQPSRQRRRTRDRCIDVKRLTAEDTKILVDFLALAVDRDQLAEFVYLATGDRLFVEFVSPDLPLKPMLRKLIEQLELGPVTDKVLRVVYRGKPYQADLRTFIAQLDPTIPAAAARVPLVVGFQQAGQPAAADSAGPGLERNIRPALASPDTDLWLGRFEQIKLRVCRIEVNQAGIGTGFLVGPGAVLTNWHVVRAARNAGLEGALACRFDYRRLVGGGTDPGTLVPVAAVVAERPCSDAELGGANPDQPPPTPDQLDYALLRLPAPMPERGFLALSDPPPIAPDAALIIVQHPKGDPMRFALDTDAVIGLVHGGLRLRYRTNTEAGSSGSPCFGMEWDLQALHHLGDPAMGTDTFNQGIPVGLIRASIQASGEGALLG